MEYEHDFPTASTCDCSMRIRCFKDKDTMKNTLLTAFRTCGEIDADSEGSEYGSENADDVDSNHDNDRYAGENDYDSQCTTAASR